MKFSNNIKKFLILSIFLTFCSSCKFPTSTSFYSKNIITSSKLKTVLKFSQKNDLVIFDIDETLLKPYLLGLNNEKHFFEYGLYKLINDYIIKTNTNKNIKELILKIKNLKIKKIKKRFKKYLIPLVNEKMHQLWAKLQYQVKFDAMEKGIPSLINKLKKQDCKIIAFTAREWNIHKKTENDLKNIGINLSDNIYNNKIEVKPSAKYYGFGYNGKGILFVIRSKNFTSRTEKGRILIEFLNKINYKPKQIIFIDNRLENVEDVIKYLDINKIPTTGIWYKYKGYKNKPILHENEVPIINKYLGNNWFNIDIKLEKAINFIQNETLKVQNIKQYQQNI